jgi:hypothetical protein
MRPGNGAQQVVRGVHVGHPVPQRLVDGVLEGARPGLHRDDLSTEQPHPSDVERLALGVHLSHVDHALQPEQRACGRGGDPMLAGPGLGDHPRFTHPLGEQRLAQHIVDFV